MYHKGREFTAPWTVLREYDGAAAGPSAEVRMSDGRRSIWLRREIERWVAEGLVSPVQAETIRKRYPEEAAGVAWSTVLFPALGAVTIGLGVVLLVAYNWDAIPRLGKIAVLALGVAAAHGAGLALRARGSEALAEGSALFGTMLYGSGIWLVAQAYHRPVDSAAGFLLWSLGAIAVAWAAPSVAHGIVASVLLVCWSFAEWGNGPGSWGLLGPVLVVVAAGGLAWRLRSRLLVGVAAPAFVFSTMAAFTRSFHPWPTIAAAIGLGGLLVGCGFLLERRGAFPAAAAIVRAWGWGTFWGSLYVACFPMGLVEDAPYFGAGSVVVPRAVAGGAAALACAAWIGVEGLRRQDGTSWTASRPKAEHVLIPLAAVLAFADNFYLGGLDRWGAAAPFNVVYLVLAFGLMVRGTERARPKEALGGTLLFLALVAARFFDFFESFLSRGLVFLVVGGVLLAQGLLYARARRRQPETAS